MADSQSPGEIEESGGEVANGRRKPAEPVEVEGRDHLREIVERSSVTLVNFHAEWSGPCKMLEPTVEKIAAKTSTTVAKVDIDRRDRAAAEFSIRSVPTLLVFVGGDLENRIVGVRESSDLFEVVGQYGSVDG